MLLLLIEHWLWHVKNREGIGHWSLVFIQVNVPNICEYKTIDSHNEDIINFHRLGLL